MKQHEANALADELIKLVVADRRCGERSETMQALKRGADAANKYAFIYSGAVFATYAMVKVLA